MTNREKLEEEIHEMSEQDFIRLMDGGLSDPMRYSFRLCAWCRRHRFGGRKCREEDVCPDEEFLQAEVEG